MTNINQSLKPTDVNQHVASTSSMVRTNSEKNIQLSQQIAESSADTIRTAQEAQKKPLKLRFTLADTVKILDSDDQTLKYFISRMKKRFQTKQNLANTIPQTKASKSFGFKSPKDKNLIRAYNYHTQLSVASALHPNQQESDRLSVLYSYLGTQAPASQLSEVCDANDQLAYNYPCPKTVKNLVNLIGQERTLQAIETIINEDLGWLMDSLKKEIGDKIEILEDYAYLALCVDEVYKLKTSPPTEKYAWVMAVLGVNKASKQADFKFTKSEKPALSTQQYMHGRLAATLNQTYENLKTVGQSDECQWKHHDKKMFKFSCNAFIQELQDSNTPSETLSLSGLVLESSLNYLRKGKILPYETVKTDAEGKQTKKTVEPRELKGYIVEFDKITAAIQNSKKFQQHDTLDNEKNREYDLLKSVFEKTSLMRKKSYGSNNINFFSQHLYHLSEKAVKINTLNDLEKALANSDEILTFIETAGSRNKSDDFYRIETSIAELHLKAMSLATKNQTFKKFPQIQRLINCVHIVGEYCHGNNKLQRYVGILKESSQEIRQLNALLAEKIVPLLKNNDFGKLSELILRNLKNLSESKDVNYIQCLRDFSAINSADLYLTTIYSQMSKDAELTTQLSDFYTQLKEFIYGNDKMPGQYQLIEKLRLSFANFHRIGEAESPLQQKLRMSELRSILGVDTLQRIFKKINTLHNQVLNEQSAEKRNYLFGRLLGQITLYKSSVEIFTNFAKRQKLPIDQLPNLEGVENEIEKSFIPFTPHLTFSGNKELAPIKLYEETVKFNSYEDCLVFIKNSISISKTLDEALNEFNGGRHSIGILGIYHPEKILTAAELKE